VADFGAGRLRSNNGLGRHSTDRYMSSYAVTPDDVRQRFRFAGRRLEDIHHLNGGNFAGAPADDKHQLVQEFFFHLGAALELAAQLVNTELQLGLSSDKVTLARVIASVPATHNALAHLQALYAKPRHHPMPADPYSDNGIVWRAYKLSAPGHPSKPKSVLV
jgi:hypothetical protein